MHQSAVLSPPHAILFVFDPTNKSVDVPRYVDGELTASNDTCVSVGTQAEVDGDTEISLANASEPSIDGLKQVFSGEIVTPGKKVAIVTSQFRRILEMDVSGSAIALSIQVDHSRNPTRVAVIVKDH